MKIGPCTCSDWLKAHGVSEYNIKHRKSLFYCFPPITSVSKQNEKGVYYTVIF